MLLYLFVFYNKLHEHLFYLRWLCLCGYTTLQLTFIWEMVLFCGESTGWQIQLLVDLVLHVVWWWIIGTTWNKPMRTVNSISNAAAFQYQSRSYKWSDHPLSMIQTAIPHRALLVVRSVISWILSINYSSWLFLFLINAANCLMSTHPTRCTV